MGGLILHAFLIGRAGVQYTPVLFPCYLKLKSGPCTEMGIQII